MQVDMVTRCVAGSIDMAIGAELVECLGELAGVPTAPDQLIDRHWR